MTLAPPREQLDELRRLHGSVDRVAAALGEPRSTVRSWYAGERRPHLELVGGDGLSHDASDDGQEIPVFFRDYSHLDSLRVYSLGDVHKGAHRHDVTRWREWLAYLEDNDDTSLLGTGDFLNAAIVGSKSDVYDETMTVGQAKREVRRELEPLAQAGRIDLLLQGNHEERISRNVGDCPVEDIADSLGVPYARASAVVIYLVGDVEYIFFARHGTGSGQSLVGLQKGALVVHADVYVTGHVHNQAVRADEVFVVEGRRVVRKRRMYVSSGSFLQYEAYAAQRGYVPTRLGAPRIHLDGRRHDVHISL